MYGICIYMYVSYNLYEGGFFYFVIRCLLDYLIRVSRVKFMIIGDN